jgi:hypothetical protein
MEGSMGLRVSIFLLAWCGPNMMLGQTAAAVPASSPVAKVDLPSATLQPALDVLKQAVNGVKTEKWKTSAAVRSETDANLASIRRDLEATLPPLLATADAAPDSTVKVLPPYRNVEALYDVVLRIDAAARLSAPVDQASALDQALARLDDSRRALGDQLQRNAGATEKQVADLQAALKAVPPPPPPPVPVACPVVPAKKKTTKPAAKPAAPAPSN